MAPIFDMSIEPAIVSSRVYSPTPLKENPVHWLLPLPCANPASIRTRVALLPANQLSLMTSHLTSLSAGHVPSQIAKLRARSFPVSSHESRLAGVATLRAEMFSRAEFQLPDVLPA
jgi:hypothetical protein